MIRRASRGLVVLLLFVLYPSLVGAQLVVQQVATGLVLPVGFVQMPSDPAVQVVVEQIGRVRVLRNNVLQPGAYLDLTGAISAGGEQGLLGLAFSPTYAIDGRVFVNFTDSNGNTVIARFTCTTDLLHADVNTRKDLVWPGGLPYIVQPASNHNGGNLAFGPDGFLYVGLGDGGSANDPFQNAQNPMSLLGKMLRLNVSVSTSDPEGYDVPVDNPFVGRGNVLPEIWDFGLRNPWRWSFDDPAHGGTGALIIGDVGQGAWEEIDYEPAGAGGRNYGWPYREGSHDNVTTAAVFSPMTNPIFEYGRDTGATVIGGVIYRGTALGAAMRGRYIFADFVSQRVWTLGLDVNPLTGQATATDRSEVLGLGLAAVNTSSFGVDAAGEVYLLSLSGGAVFRLSGTSGGGPVNSCTIPDPFASLGGGTCVNGGWLPPGSTAPVPAPPPPTTPPPSSGTCATPDPFASLGGGTCVNGGWLPPGAVPAAPPTPPPPPTGTGCQTPDPFTSLGGGTCVNGGWLPPGAVLPPSSGSGSPTPPPPPPPAGCVGPDPFATLTSLKGLCVNGGWIPVPR
ncbi:MAG: PQQ-dependent sugar dehydrogenase [Vicinamibacterales bacterium]